MKQFSILRYIRQFSLLILLFAFVGSVAIYRYGKSQQRYVASAVIRYTNAGAKEGYTPDGSPLNVEEIYSSTVIDAALKELGYEAHVDSIRSNCYVEEIIPESQQKLSEVLLEKGEESTYTPDTYRVVFVGGNTTSESYAGTFWMRSSRITANSTRKSMWKSSCRTMRHLRSDRVTMTLSRACRFWMTRYQACSIICSASVQPDRISGPSRQATHTVTCTIFINC